MRFKKKTLEERIDKPIFRRDSNPETQKIIQLHKALNQSIYSFYWQAYKALRLAHRLPSKNSSYKSTKWENIWGFKLLNR
jgi:hypothetical protein